MRRLDEIRDLLQELDEVEEMKENEKEFDKDLQKFLGIPEFGYQGYQGYVYSGEFSNSTDKDWDVSDVSEVSNVSEINFHLYHKKLVTVVITYQGKTYIFSHRSSPKNFEGKGMFFYYQDPEHPGRQKRISVRVDTDRIWISIRETYDDYWFDSWRAIVWVPLSKALEKKDFHSINTSKE